MRTSIKNCLKVFFVLSLIITGGMAVGAESTSAKSVIKSVDYKKNNFTGSRGNSFNYVYFTVPSSAYLNSTRSTKIDDGFLHDTYREYWIYYSSQYRKYYP